MYKYSVCFLIDPSKQTVLLCMKNKTAYKNKLNGVGGEARDGEDISACALREIQEETGYSLSPEMLIPLGCLSAVKDTKHDHTSSCELWFYAAIVDQNLCTKTETDCGEPLFWCSLSRIIRRSADSTLMAGDGDIQLFLNKAVKALDIELEPDKSEPMPTIPPVSEKAMHRHVANYLANDLGFNKNAVQDMITAMLESYNAQTMLKDAVYRSLPKPKGFETYPQMLERLVQKEVSSQLKTLIDTSTKMKLTKAASEYTDKLVDSLMTTVPQTNRFDMTPQGQDFSAGEEY